MSVKAVLVFIVAALAAGACGSPMPSGTAPPSPTVTAGGAGTASPAPSVGVSPTPSRTLGPAPTGSGSRTVTESDSGATVRLSVGETVLVSLGSDYDPPVAQGDMLDRTSSTGGYPTGRPADATFRAVRAGSADITSTTDYACLHATPSCAVPQRLWVVHVIVSP